MNIEELREYCIKKKGVTEEFPFGETALVFKVRGKMFALLNIEGEIAVNLKCDPERAMELRERYASVTPGYHMSKVHWNTVKLDNTIPNKLLYSWIDHSYQLVVDKLPKRLRDGL